MDIMSMRPEDLPEFAIPAWLSCMTWAIGEPEIVAAFRSETGLRWQPGRTPFDVAIDRATKVDERFIAAWVPWFNDNVWGKWESDGERDDD